MPGYSYRGKNNSGLREHVEPYQDNTPIPPYFMRWVRDTGIRHGRSSVIYRRHEPYCQPVSRSGRIIRSIQITSTGMKFGIRSIDNIDGHGNRY